MHSLIDECDADAGELIRRLRDDERY